MAKVVRMPPVTPDRRAVHLHGHQLYHANRMRAVEKEFPGNQDYVVTPSGHEDRRPGGFEKFVLWCLGHRD
jgi:hypothetical protein